MNRKLIRTGRLLLAAIALLIPTACRRAEHDVGSPLTSTKRRAARRAYDGAPPVIPHEPLGTTCTTCHTSRGKAIPSMAFAPANPHSHRGNVQNCRQCHLFRRTDEVFADSDYMAYSTKSKGGDRAYPGAPPTMPHSLLMRENCVACHCTATARPEFRCSHPERVNCVQCHLVQTHAAEFATVAHTPLAKEK